MEIIKLKANSEGMININFGLVICAGILSGWIFIYNRSQSAPHQLHADTDVDALIVVEVPFAFATLHGAAVSLLLANERFVG